MMLPTKGAMMAGNVEEALQMPKSLPTVFSEGMASIAKAEEDAQRPEREITGENDEGKGCHAHTDGGGTDDWCSSYAIR